MSTAPSRRTSRVVPPETLSVKLVSSWLFLMVLAGISGLSSRAALGQDLLNTGRVFEVGASPQSLVIEDIDDDGLADLVIGRSLGASTLLGNGDGTFQPRVEFESARPISQLVLADVDRDGLIDLLAVSENMVIVALKDGSSGTFRVAGRVTYPNSIRHIAAADFNDDGPVDLVATISNSVVRLDLGNGNGGFDHFPGTGLPFITDVFQVVAEDFNRDGSVDLAITQSGVRNPDDTLTFLNNGAAQFQAHQTFDRTYGLLNSADFDGDGILDLVNTFFFDRGGVCVCGGLFLKGEEAGNFTQQAVRRFLTGNHSHTADFDTDGLPDVVVTSGPSGDRILFVPGIDFPNPPGERIERPTGPDPVASASADFDQDGLMDLAVLDREAGFVSIHRGNAAVPPDWYQLSSVNTAGEMILAGDFVADDHADIVTGGATVGVLAGDGTGIFTPAARLSHFRMVTDLATGDFNEDGHLDLVAAGDQATVAYGDGTGSFQKLGLLLPASSSNQGGVRFNRVYVFDRDGDGHLDLELSKSGSSTPGERFSGDGTGHFSEAPGNLLGFSFFPGFIDDDEFLDWYYVTDFGGRVAFGQSNGSFIIEGAGPSYAEHAVIADIDGDGDGDLSGLTDGDDRFTVFFYDELADPADPNFTPFPSFRRLTPTAGAYGMASADFNEDGRQDLAVALRSLDQIEVFFGATKQAPPQTATFATGDRPIKIFAADVDADGHTDVITADRAGTISILYNDGNGTFLAPCIFPVGPNPRAVTVGDFNEDGIPDVAVGDPGESSVRILLGDGSRGLIQPQQSFGAGGGSEMIAKGDFDEDGYLDVVAANRHRLFSEQTIALYRGPYDGPRTSIPIVFRSSNSELTGGVTATDANGDGHLDVVTANGEARTVSALLGDGTGNFGAPLISTAPVRAGRLAAGTIDQDGSTDLVVATESGPEVAVMLNDGSGNFSVSQTVIANEPGEVADLALADADGDGDLDVIALIDLGNDGLRGSADPDGNDVFVIWLNRGDGTLGIQASFPAASNVERFDAFDVDGQGGADILFPNSESNSVAILWNRSGTGYSPPARYLSGPAAPSAVLATDIDQDDDADVLVLQIRRHPSTSRTSIYLATLLNRKK